MCGSYSAVLTLPVTLVLCSGRLMSTHINFQSYSTNLHQFHLSTKVIWRPNLFALILRFYVISAWYVNMSSSNNLNHENISIYIFFYSQSQFIFMVKEIIRRSHYQLWDCEIFVHWHSSSAYLLKDVTY